jgi:hypothetical protein
MMTTIPLPICNLFHLWFRASLLEQQKRDEEARKKKEKEEAEAREKQK